MSRRQRIRVAREQKRRLRLHFLGAARTVTGSMHFFEYTENGKTVRFFVDTGLNQQDPATNFQNRLPAGLKAADIDFGILSHAHIDHVGYLPKLVKDGFKGKVYTSKPTQDLLGIQLIDSGRIQEEEARERNLRESMRRPMPAGRKQTKTGKTAKQATKKQKQSAKPKDHKPVVHQPLYTEADAKNALACVHAFDFNVSFKPAPSIAVKFTRASHLLGAAVVSLEIGTGGTKRRVVFSGDLGRPGMPILKDLEPVKLADYVICEGTYGGRLHPQRDRLEELAVVINRAFKRASKPQGKSGHGVILIPAFAIGRVQGLLFELRQLMHEKRIPDLPVFVNSPMANRATSVFRKHVSEYNAKTARAAKDGDPFTTPQYVEVIGVEESKLLDQPSARPIIIISSSGMATAGRVVHHLKTRLPLANSTVVFVGYQSEGTLGQQLISGKNKIVRIGGEEIPIRATVDYLRDYSGHADSADILRWLGAFNPKPKQLFLVHGDQPSLNSLKETVEQRLHLKVTIPNHRDYVDLE